MLDVIKHSADGYSQTLPRKDRLCSGVEVAGNTERGAGVRKSGQSVGVNTVYKSTALEPSLEDTWYGLSEITHNVQAQGLRWLTRQG